MKKKIKVFLIIVLAILVIHIAYDLYLDYSLRNSKLHESIFKILFSSEQMEKVK